MPTLAQDLALAHELADLADRVTLARFGATDLRVESKPDRTPVTDADRAVETALRAALAESRPGDAVLGEEYGDAGDGDRRWVIDPIDGTKNYLRGVPVWATLIGLQDGGTVTVGVVSAPALYRRWWAHRGGGAWVRVGSAEPRRCRVSAVRQLADASLSYSSHAGWAGSRFEELTAQVWRTRAYGDFWSHLLVAEGAVDVAAEPEVSLWDLAALQVIVEEAGGRCTDRRGRADPAGGSVICSNGLLHPAVLGYLGTR